MAGSVVHSICTLCLMLIDILLSIVPLIVSSIHNKFLESAMPRSVLHTLSTSYRSQLLIYILTLLLRRFLIALSAYKQMWAQEHSILRFQQRQLWQSIQHHQTWYVPLPITQQPHTANTNLPTLPVIQGDADVGKCLNKNELQKVIAFCYSCPLTQSTPALPHA